MSQAAEASRRATVVRLATRLARLAIPVTCLMGVLVDAEPVRAQAAGDVTRGGWLTEHRIEYGGFRQLNAYAAQDQDRGWGIDITRDDRRQDQSLMIRRDGPTWRVAQILGTHLTALDLDGEVGLAVGRSGAASVLQAGRWVPTAAPTRWHLNDVAIGGGTAWAVGEVGTVLTWGPGWQVDPFPDEVAALVAVAIQPDGHPVALGVTGNVWERRDGEWQPMADAPVVSSAEDMAFAPDGRALIAGRGLWERRDGQWTEVDVGIDRVVSVAYSAGIGYAVGGDGSLLSDAGGVWRATDVESLGGMVTSVSGGPHALAYNRAGGIAEISGLRTELLWPRLTSVWTLAGFEDGSPDWAGGIAHTHVIVGRTGDAWSRPVVPTATGVGVSDIVLTGGGTAWAAGSTAGAGAIQGRMWQFDGEEWAIYPLDPTIVVTDLDPIAPNDIWASGLNAVVRWNGDSWKLVEGAPHADMSGPLAMLRNVAEPTGFFGGDAGGVWELSEGTWSEHDLGVDGAVIALTVHADDEGIEIWALTDRSLHQGMAATAAPVEWSEVPLPLVPEETVFDMTSPEPGSAWLLTSGRRLLHWQGAYQTWSEHSLAAFGAQTTFGNLEAAPLPDGSGWEAWLTGDQSTIARVEVRVPTERIYLPRTWRGN